jgi:plastocyanin
LKPGGRGSVTLHKPGVIAFSCRYHPGMKGTITVRR